MRPIRGPAVAERDARAPRREGADPDHPFRGERIDEAPQVAVARREEPLLLVRRQAIRRPVAPARLEEQQRAVVRDVVAREEALGTAPVRRHRAPQPRAAHLAAAAGEALDRALRVRLRRAADGRLDAEPVADEAHLTERHSRLRHAEGARVHAEKDHALARRGVARDVARVRAARVVERVVDAGDRRPEAQRCDLAHEIAGRGGDPPGDAGGGRCRRRSASADGRIGSAWCASARGGFRSHPQTFRMLRLACRWLRSGGQRVMDGGPADEFRVRFDGVHLRRGDRRVFDGLSCGFTRAQITVVLGGSGAGKTTMLRLIGGLSRPESGSVYVAGRGRHAALRARALPHASAHRDALPGRRAARLDDDLRERRAAPARAHAALRARDRRRGEPPSGRGGTARHREPLPAAALRRA